MPLQQVQRHRPGRQQHAGPNERRRYVGEQKLPRRHRQHARRERHRTTGRSEKAANEDRTDAEPAHERLASRDEIGITGERPHACKSRLKAEAEPIGHPVARSRPDRRGGPDRNEVDPAGPTRAPMPTSATVAGTNRPTTASDSPKASAATTGNSQVSWARTNSTAP
jgi:hypothetical protein